MATTKLKIPEVLDFPNDSLSTANTGGTVIPAGGMGIDVDYLVVGGGGAGASAYGGVGGGGGGAGGLRTSYPGGSGGGGSSESTLSLRVSTAYTIDVGIGGSGSAYTDGNIATDAGNSTFASITSEKGGNAKSYISGGTAGQSQTGGSGGGGVGWSSITPGNGTINQGYDGGAGQTNSSTPYRGGGGGGAGSAGVASLTSGNGGDGLQVNIDGLNNFYAAGGGGGAYTGAGTGGSSIGGNGGANNTSGCADGTAGATNTGSGGGGGVRSGGASCGVGGDGSDGIIILRVASTTTATFSAGVTSTLTQDGGGAWSSGDKIYTITATSSANETVTFTSTLSRGILASSLTDGEFRFNTTLGYLEYYDGTNWYQIADEYITGQPTSCLCRYPNNTNVALYTFQDNTDDTCGNYNGTPNNLEPYTASGKYRKAAVFNGTNSYVQISHTFDFSKDFSVSMWINPTTLTAATYYSIFSTDGYGGGGNIGFNIYAYGTALRPWIEISTSYYDLFNTGTVATGVWQHVVLTRAYDDKWELYLDGTSLGTYNSQGITTNFTSTSFNNIGKSANSTHYFDGSIDQTRIFTSALSQAQVTELYNEIACN